MPEIKLTEVKDYTLQDEKHPVENLLSGRANGGKWLIPASRSASSMTATFQLAKCCVISSVHIGNSGSAFVSLLVSRTGCSEFKDLLPCCAMMTVQQSRSGQNKNCVKLFNKDDFLEATKKEKWDLLRVVVTQPFNQRMQFGVCFLRVFSFQEEETESTKVNSDSFSKLEKMRSQINSPLSPPSSKLAGQQFSGSPLTRKDKLFRLLGQQHNKLQENRKTTLTRARDEECEGLFEAVVLSFMESLNLCDKDLDNIALIDVQKKMEKVHGRELSLEERHTFFTVVKDYVISLKDTKSNDAKSQHLDQTIETEPRSKEEFVKPKELIVAVNLPQRDSGARKKLILGVECSANSGGDGTGSMDTQRDYSTDASTSRTSCYDDLSPAARRNLICLEDSGRTLESMRHERKRTEPQEVNPDVERCTRENLVECPVCGVYFESDIIENHSSECVSFSDNPVTEDSVIQELTCPLCLKKFSAAIIDAHANVCASQMFGD
ncbi:uncharacterized protein LOC110833550 isoform X2 [Zootermopsis nevadensis]|uniref:uncharacterized protein LOC110833550 isoform X2 n=1 Tax=Zootermopsis nevadensis TaxID=136037 RepID=UPI000B8E525D|nr:uncharacterized protein LOC110833550 isoform X2 [Zootermopsis nevadensis]